MKIFVMGMHRSGTSMIMGILSRCGVYVGNNLLMGAKDNPKGHFEDRRFLRINDRILRLNGGSWHKPPLFPDYKNMKKEMKEFLSLPEWDRKVVGWKDPRICITFPLWYELIHPEEIRVIITHRPEREIARSLKKRNEIPIEKGKELSRFYNRKAFENTKKRGVKIFVSYYHSYFRNWKSELESVCDFLGVGFPKDVKDLNWIRDFIDPELWHHKGAIR